jgi:putative MFS transporter
MFFPSWRHPFKRCRSVDILALKTSVPKMKAAVRRLDALGPSEAAATRLLAWVGVTWAIHSLELAVFTFTRAMVDRDIGMGRLTLKLLGASTAIGSFVGGPLFGLVADARGRRTALALAMVLSLVGFVLLATAQDQVGVLTARIVAGVGLGGEIPTAVVLIYEFAPRCRRAQSIALLPAFTGIGGVVGVLLAFFVTPVLGWRGLYGILSALMLLVTVVCMGLAESPRWLLDAARMDEALATIDELERVDKSRKGNDKDLLVPLLDAGASRPSTDYSNRAAEVTTRPTLLVLFLLWMTFIVSAFALGSYLPSLISLTGFNVYASWSTCTLLYVAQIPGALLASTLLDRRHSHHADHERHDSTTDDGKTTLALFAVVTAVLALGVSYLPPSASGAVVTTGVSLVSALLASVWSVVLAYTPGHFPVACRARGVGFAVAAGGIGGFFGAVVVFPRFYNVWMLSRHALAWIFGAALVAVAAVLVPRFGVWRKADG